MQKTKKSMLASGLAVLVCAAMLIGTTFAWFTDSVTNKGNKIQAGNLSIGATVASVDSSEGTYRIEGINGGKTFGFGDAVDLNTSTKPIISEEYWEPGQSNAKLLTVRNDGSLAVKIKLDFMVKDGGLTDALWFDFIQVKNNEVIGEFQKRPMNSLTDMSNVEFSLKSGESISFILIYGMYEEAGNEFQGAEFSADVTILAKQATVEKDGFGNSDYDAHAAYAVSAQTADEVTAALKNGKNVSLENNIDEVFTINNSNTDVTVNLNGKTVCDPNDEGGNGVFQVQNGTLTLCGNGTVNGLGKNNYSMAVWANNNGTVKITDGYYTNVGAGSDDHYDLIYASDNASIYISGGTFKCHTPAWTLNLKDASNAKIVVTGGTFYQFDPSNCASEGERTNFVAEGYKVVQDGDWYTVVPE